ncbi:XdhC/CoxI family protein [[Clostridium] aminophilum]|uniref:XdhC/CoxI family protein n=1 Tax=[Clostridium] aminophilum TaxID=1526 RepID=UPI003F9944F7
MSISYYSALSRINPREEYLSLITIDGPSAGEKILYRLTKDGPVSLAEAIPDSRETRGFRHTDPPALPPLAPSDPTFRTGSGLVYAERFGGKTEIVLCGAGHVALAVTRMAKLLSMHVTVIDDRSEFTEKAEAAGADRVICDSFEHALDGIPGNANTAFIVMTRAHAYDKVCLRKILEKPYLYLGMMGSHGRTALIREEFLASGYTKKTMDTVHMPIGLEIHSETPEEIAVSILAELICIANSSAKGFGYSSEMLSALRSAAAGPLAMAVIVRKEGEAPRNPGAKLFVRPDGTFVGTIGGGFAEAMIRKAGLVLLNGGDGAEALDRELSLHGGRVLSRTGARMLIDLSIHAAADDMAGMFCGGSMLVYVERTDITS